MYGLDWIAAVMGILGMYFLSKKNKCGFIIQAIMCLLWVAVGVLTGIQGLIVSSVIFFFLNIGCYYKWCKNEKNPDRN